MLIVAFTELVVGELVPKSLALRYGDLLLVLRRAIFAARALSQIMRPLVWVLTSISNLFLRLFGDRTTFSEARLLSRDELQQLVEEAA